MLDATQVRAGDMIVGMEIVFSPRGGDRGTTSPVDRLTAPPEFVELVAPLCQGWGCIYFVD